MSVPAQPFVRVASGAGYIASNLHNLYAWLQSDVVREQQITRIQVGPALYTVLGGTPVLRVSATEADPEMFPTGPRQSPQDDLTFQVFADSALGPTEVWLLHQVPPGQP